MTVRWFPEAEAERSPWEATKIRRKKTGAAQVAAALLRGLKSFQSDWHPDIWGMLAPFEHWGVLLQKNSVQSLLKPLNAEEVAVGMTIANREGVDGPEILQLLLTERGLVETTIIFLRMVSWLIQVVAVPASPKHAAGSRSTFLKLDGYPLRMRLRNMDSELLFLRREWLASAQRPVAALSEFRETLDLERRILLHFMVPLQPEWAEADLEAVLADPSQDGFVMMLMAAPLSPASTRKLWERASSDPGWGDSQVRWGFDAVAKIGDEAWPGVESRLVEVVDGKRVGDFRRIGRLAALFSQAAPHFAAQAEHLILSSFAVDFFRRHPEMAITTLHAALGQRSHLAGRQAEILRNVCRREESAIRALLPGLDPKLAAKVEKLLPGGEEIPLEELPDWLKNPPWRTKKPEFPAVAGRALDEFAVSAMGSRNRPEDGGTGEGFFQEAPKTTVRRGTESNRKSGTLVWRADRFRLLLNAVLLDHEDRGLAISLLSYVLADDPAMAAQIPAEERPLIDTLLAVDSIYQCPDKIGKLPSFVDIEGLPRPLMRDGRHLPVEAVRVLVEMLSFTPKLQTYAGLNLAKELLDPVSLEALAWGLTSAWAAGPASPPTAWAIFSLLHLGNENSLRKLLPLARRLLREEHTRAGQICIEVFGILASRGSDLALLYLAIFQKAREADVQKQVQQLLEQACQRLGIPPEELEERLIPDLDLAPDATTILDYGPRQVEVRFDENLEAQLFADGERLKTIPKVSKTDDPEKAAAAVERWKAIKADSKTLLTQLRRRVETAMILGRRWKISSFRSLMLGHPLIALLSRRLVWGLWEAGQFRTFRIAEDSSLADEEDALFELPEQGIIGLPHPIELPFREQWVGILQDYGVIQPFPQVSREIFRPTEEEMTGTTVKNLPPNPIPWHPLRGAFDARGWTNEGPNGFVRRVRGGKASLTYTGREEVTLSALQFDSRIRDIPAVLYSEVRRDIELFRK